MKKLKKRRLPKRPPAPRRSRSKPGFVRIISGTHRSRRLPILDAPGLRPTGDRSREILFNWLQPYLPGAQVLDAYAGTGALGLEAASRGAGKVVLVENNPQVEENLRATINTMDFPNSEVVNNTALRFLDFCGEDWDLVFLDPPFSLDELDAASLKAAEKIKTGGFLYREFGADRNPAPLPAPWERFRHKQVGQIQLELWRKNP